MTKTMLQYIRKRIDAGRIPEEQLAIYEIIYEMARRVDALESNAQNTHAAQSGSDKDADLVQIAHRDYTDALRWLGIAASEGLDHSTRISFIEDAIDALRKCSKDESKL